MYNIGYFWGLEIPALWELKGTSKLEVLGTGWERSTTNEISRRDSLCEIDKVIGKGKTIEFGDREDEYDWLGEEDS